MLLTLTPTGLAVWTFVSLVVGVVLTLKVQKFIKTKTA